MILASHALLAIKGLRPPGVLDKLPGKLGERLAETCGAKPPEVRHGHVATALDDRGNASEGEPVLDVFIPAPTSTASSGRPTSWPRTGSTSTAFGW